MSAEITTPKTAAKCPDCGGTEFIAPYTEVANQCLTAKADGPGLTAGEDGVNVQEHALDLAEAECYDCGAKVDLSGREVE